MRRVIALALLLFAAAFVPAFASQERPTQEEALAKCNAWIGGAGAGWTCDLVAADFDHRDAAGGYRAQKQDEGYVYATAWFYNDAPPKECKQGEFTAGWPENGGDSEATYCRDSCEQKTTIEIGGANPSFGTYKTGNQCAATAPPWTGAPTPPGGGYTPDDPQDPDKGGTYCDESGKTCVHGPAPNTGGDGGTGGNNGGTGGNNGGTGGNNGGGNTGGDGGNTGGGNTGGGNTGGGNTGGGNTGGGNTGGGNTGGGNTGGGNTGGGNTGGGNTGGGNTGGGNTGGGNGDGSGGTGGGNGDGSGGDDDEDKCTAGDACNAGEAAAVPGAFYTSSGKTVSDAFNQYKGQVMTSPLLSTATGFFKVEATGSCPVWAVPASKWTPELRFGFLCDGSFARVFELAGWIILALAVFHAFRIAVY